MLEITLHSLSAVLIVMFMVGIGFLFGRLGYIKKEHKGLMIKLIISAGMPALVEAAMEALRSLGINKVALVVFSKNGAGNGFWEKLGFTTRDDLIYRNRAITEMIRIDT